MSKKVFLVAVNLASIFVLLLLLERNEKLPAIFAPSEVVTSSATVINITANQNPIPMKEVLHKMTQGELELLYQRYVMAPQTTCSKVERMGKLTDGGWEMCLDPRYAPSSSNCLVYSFGINHDFSFDDAMERYGCEVHSFDPSMNNVSDHLRGQKVHFHLEGIGPKDKTGPNKWQLYTMRTFRIRYNHAVGQRRLDIMKMDVEGAEIDSLPVAFKDGSLSDVPQLAFELHSSGGRVLKILKLLREAYDHGLRIYMTNKNLVCKFKSQYTGYTRTSCHEVYMVNTTLAR